MDYVNSFYMSEFRRLLNEREEKIEFERGYNWKLRNKNFTKRELQKHPELKHIYDDFDKKTEGLAIVCYSMRHPNEPRPTGVSEAWERYLSAFGNFK
jgi:hypothetical protein